MPQLLLLLLFSLLFFGQGYANDSPYDDIRPVPEHYALETQKTLSKREFRKQQRARKRAIRASKRKAKADFPPPCDTLITTSGAQLLIQNYRLTETYIEYEGCMEDGAGKRRMPIQKIVEIRTTNGIEKMNKEKPSEAFIPEQELLEKSSENPGTRCDTISTTSGKLLFVGYFEIRQNGVFYLPCDSVNDAMVQLAPEDVHEIRTKERVIAVHEMLRHKFFTKKGKKIDPLALRLLAGLILAAGLLILLYAFLIRSLAQSCLGCLGEIIFAVFLASSLKTLFTYGIIASITGLALLLLINFLARNWVKRYYLKKKP